MKLTLRRVRKIRETIAEVYRANYRTHESKWVDVDNSFALNISKKISIEYDSWTVWHKRHNWRGTSARYTFNIPLSTDVFLSGGLLTFTKGKKAWWVEQARGCDIKLVEGYFYKGYHLEKSKAKNFKDAVLKITKTRNKTAKELLKARLLKNMDLKKVFVSIEDSLKSGNCASGTENFTKKIKNVFGEIGGIRADELLRIEDNLYTRRAIAIAKCKYL